MASETINMCLQNPKNSKCRACLSEENLLSLFSHGLSVKIMKLADIKIYEGDGLPSTICIDCEVEVKRCYNFVAQIKRADAKLREMLENNEDSSEISENEEDLKENGKSEEASASQIDIEELNIKQEALDSFIDEKQEKMSDTDHAHYDDVPDTIGDENKLNPLNQVDIVVDPLGGEGMDVAIDPLGQEEPLIDSNKIYCEPAIDPLTFVKVEGVAMDVDKVDPFVPDAGPSGSSCTTVTRTQTGVLYYILPTLCSSFTLPKENNLPFNIDENVNKNTGALARESGTVELSGVSAKNGYSTLSKCASDISKRSPVNLKTNDNDTCPTDEEMSTNFKVTKKGNDVYCVICNMTFVSVGLFEDHKESKGCICRVCTEEFSTHRELETHFFNHKAYKCKACKEEFFCKKDILLHKETHKFENFECQICNKTFSRIGGLRRHKKLNHSDIEDIHKCIVCQKSFKLSYQLKYHLENAHIVYENVECTLCHNVYFGPERLKSHIKAIHLGPQENTPTTCPICGKYFNREKLLTKHLELHDDTISLCDICGMSVKGKVAMKYHMDTVHSISGVFTCNICNKQFNAKQLLYRHNKNAHYKKSPRSPVYCEICGKVYKDSSILKKHKLIHSSDRPFKCDVCGASFKQNVTLSLHSRVHSSVGKYCCKGCGTTFKWKQTFDKHTRKCKPIAGRSDSGE